MTGKVYLVGAGPGAPDLLTLRAAEVLKRANVVLYDRLVDPRVLKYAEHGEKIYCGKKSGEAYKQSYINRLMYSEAKKDRTVVRLKNGDPSIFARGSEELQYLLERGIDVEVVPGPSSAISVPSLAKIPLTKRGVSSGLTIVTARRAGGRVPHWGPLGDTVVVLMPIGELPLVTRRLISAGKGEDTPSALVSSSATEKERIIVSPLRRIAGLARRVGMEPPAVLVVGDVVSNLLNVKGRKIVVFRPSNEVRRTERLVRRAGGTPRIFGVCEIVPSDGDLREALSRKWDALVFMSLNGVRSAAKVADLSKFRAVAAGERTKNELRKLGCEDITMPEERSSEGIEKLIRRHKWQRVLALRSPLAKKRLKGATNLVAYSIVPKNLSKVVGEYVHEKVDFTLLTSRGFLELLLEAARKRRLRDKFVRAINESFVTSIGKRTTEFALANGIWINHELEEPNLTAFFRPNVRI